MTLAGAAPVEQDQAVAVEADLLVADVGMDQGGAAGVESGHQRRGVIHQRQHGLGHVAVDGLGERLPEGLVLLRQQIEAVALCLADRRGEQLKALVEWAQMGDLLAPELVPHAVRSGQDAPVLLPGQALAVRQQRAGDVAHHHPPGVTVALGGDDCVVDRPRHAAECAGSEQERLAPLVVRVAVDPVRPGDDALGDQTATIGERDALEDVPRPPGRDDRLVRGDIAQPRDEPRVEQDAAVGARARGRCARGGGVGPVALDAAVAEVQVVALAHRRTAIGDALEPERDSSRIQLGRPLHEPPRTGKPRCEELGRALCPGGPEMSA